MENLEATKVTIFRNASIHKTAIIKLFTEYLNTQRIENTDHTIDGLKPGWLSLKDRRSITIPIGKVTIKVVESGNGFVSMGYNFFDLEKKEVVVNDGCYKKSHSLLSILKMDSEGNELQYALYGFIEEFYTSVLKTISVILLMQLDDRTAVRDFTLRSYIYDIAGGMATEILEIFKKEIDKELESNV